MNPTAKVPLPRLSTILAVLVLAASGAAAAATLELERSDTSVAFRLGTTFHETHGLMDVAASELRFDPHTGEIDGRVVVDATSADTGNKKRDRKMHKEVLESGRYPQIVFLPRRFEGWPTPGVESEIEIIGSIEIRGTSHEVSIPARVVATETEIRGTGRFAVPYVEWGMEDPSFFMFRAKKEVLVELEFRGSVRGAGPSWLSVPMASARRPTAQQAP